jgi:oligopeptide transport system substrate-binding protein
MQLTNLRTNLEDLIDRFPKYFDARLVEGFEKLASAQIFTQNFASRRTLPHLIRIFVFHFFLQKRVEQAIEIGQNFLFSKLFLRKPHLCLIAFIPFSPKEQIVDKECIIRIFQSAIPGISEVGGSFWRCLHHELPYMSFYVEIQKLRGSSCFSHELKSLRILLEEQLAAQVQGPMVFWPFNEEEAYKQLQVLQNEFHTSHDIPQIAIYFRHQIGPSLEWLVYIVKSCHPPLRKKIDTLPHSTQVIFHCLKTREHLEMGCFSLLLPMRQFLEHHSINLFQARDRVVYYLQCMFGEIRDYNGGLFETQKNKFTQVLYNFSDQIPHFALFGDKAFHALQPVEARITLSPEDLLQLFTAISKLMCQAYLTCYTFNEMIWVFRTKERDKIDLLIKESKNKEVIYTEFDCFSFRYFCVLDKKKKSIPYFQQLPTTPTSKKILKLPFFTGAPPSLSPYLGGGDTRCGILSKLLFDGLMRWNRSGILQKALTHDIARSPCGKKYVFYLRPAQWSNGQPVTAFDYVYGWKKVLSQQWACNRPELLFCIRNGKKFYDGLCTEDEVGITAENALTLRIELEFCDPYFLEKLTLPIFFPACRSSQEPSTFNGPYLVNIYQSNLLELEKNPYYWGIERLYFSQIQINWNLNLEDALIQFDKNEIDWLGDSFAPLPLAKIRKYEQVGQLHTKSVMRFFIIYLNTHYSILSSSLIRRAMSLSLNRACMCQDIFPYSEPLYNSIPSLPGVSLENPDYAKKLFEEGLCELKCSIASLPPLILKYAQLPGHTECAHYLQATWQKALGLSIHLQGQSWNLLRSQLEQKDFHITGCFENILSPDVGEFLKRFRDKGNYSNFSNWEHRKYRLMMDEVDSQEEHDILPFIEHLNFLLNDQIPFIPICKRPILYIKNPKLQGEVFDQGGCVDFSFTSLGD